MLRRLDKEQNSNIWNATTEFWTPSFSNVLTLFISNSSAVQIKLQPLNRASKRCLKLKMLCEETNCVKASCKPKMRAEQAKQVHELKDLKRRKFSFSTSSTSLLFQHTGQEKCEGSKTSQGLQRNRESHSWFLCQLTERLLTVRNTLLCPIPPLAGRD